MVHTPYTAFFGDAFIAAHGAIGLFLLAMLWWALPRFSAARTLLGCAILLVTLSPVLGDFLKSFGAQTIPIEIEHDIFLASSCLVVAAFFASLRVLAAMASIVMLFVLHKIDGFVTDSTAELCALHMIWMGIAVGIMRRRTEERTYDFTARRSYALHDIVIFVSATLIAALAAIFILQKADGSADEWAYTWQAAVFAKGHAYATSPACDNAFQNFYVFESLGHMFVQYTPGWPYFMAPFVAVGLPWLAGPFSHGLLAVGVARVARSAVQLDGHGSPYRVAFAGWVSAFVATTGTTILLLGASRYSHVFVAALFAWALEALIVLRHGSSVQKRELRWGIILGSAIALMGATRPADGAALSIGLFVYFAYALVRGQLPWRPLAAGFGAFAFWGALTLVVLRLQLGSWLTTGYSLDKVFHPWAVARYEWPDRNTWKFALPLATGSYSWFPCSLAVGIAGVASLRRAARPLIAVFTLSFVCLDLYYQDVELGRGVDWGYGPRYESSFVVLMAVGAGIAFAPLIETARKHLPQRNAFSAGGPFAIVLCVTVVTLFRLWPLMYPGIYAHVKQHDSLNQRIRDLGIHHAVIVVAPGATGFDALDLTENLPIDLYPNQDVLIAIERKGDSTRCLRASYADRAFFHAHGVPVVVTPF